MTTLQITPKVNIDLNQLLVSMKQLQTREIKHFVAEVNALLASRERLLLTDEEEHLLSKINRELPEEVHLRHSILQEHSRNGSFALAQREELAELTEQLAAAKAERLRNLRFLAQSRNCTLYELKELFGDLLSEDAKTLLDEEVQKIKTRNHAARALLKSWAEEGDEEEQRETLEYLKKAIDEDRLSDRKFFS